ncbi:hypothetical protein V1509DRAFT_644655 [Lipomyces kononenkoae]
MNIFPDRNDPFESQSTLQHSFTSAHRVPRKTYSKRGGRTRDGKNNNNVKDPGPSAIVARTNSKVARLLKAKNESEMDVFEFDDDRDHDSWVVQRRMKKAKTERDCGSEGIEIESSSSHRRSSPSPSAPVSSKYFASKVSKSKAGLTPEWKNVDLPAAPGKTVTSPSKAVLKERVNEAWKFRDEKVKSKEDDGDETVTIKRPSKVRIMSKAEEIIVKPVWQAEDDNDVDHEQRSRNRSRLKSKSSVKQEKPAAVPICGNISRERAAHVSIAAQDANHSLPARMKRINLSSDGGDELFNGLAGPQPRQKLEENDKMEEIDDDVDMYDVTGPISTSTPNTRNASTMLPKQEEEDKVPRTKKLFTVKTDMGRQAISPVKNNRNDDTKRIMLGRIPDLSAPVVTSVAPTRKARSGISVYRDVPGISPVKRDSGLELERNTAANRDLNAAGIKVGGKKGSNLQTVVQSHMRMGNLSKSGKNGNNNTTLRPASATNGTQSGMSRYGRRVIYEDDEDEDELAL